MARRNTAGAPSTAGASGGDAGTAEVDLAALARSLDGAGDVREAGTDDVVDGVPAAAVARPTSVAGVSAVVREATVQGLVTVARGGGTALDWGVPPERVDVILDLSGLDRLVEHESGDLVVVAEAGLTLRDLQEQVGRAGQELVADVPRERYEAGSTVGGALATGASGPRRLQRLALRDLVLGATVVLADGTVAASGGKVVKNVAGYDLAKLMTGSYGTLGVVVRAAFRLHPVRPDRAYVVRTGPLEEVADLARALVASQLAPAAVELDRPAGSDEATLAVLLEGTGDAVAARAAEAAALVGGTPGAEPAWWGRLPEGPVCAKATATLVGVKGLLRAARAAEQAHGAAVALRGSAVGVLHAGITPGGSVSPVRPGDDAATVEPSQSAGGSDAATVARVVTALRAAAPSPRDGTVVVLRAPAALRDGLDVWGPVGGLELMRSIKERLDPGRNLAPGRFVGGI
ncbi:FAD-binding oxidoreductase [Georgenia sp. EYE_87]|uniref:FAD-binding oxidoreductase n=1 Tax=Georgenia sp. EYE_87 TaxID=2853448 RepID=UPI0020056945|nr:FAD-binding oxidoreductase [Georgenia sp. EYE_87]MCK6212432.1 FAD-binding oxidoreductase [Georgenia sp. EYE_87]